MHRRIAIFLISALSVLGCTKPGDGKDETVSEILLEQDLYNVEAACTALSVPYRLDPDVEGAVPEAAVDEKAAEWISLDRVGKASLEFIICVNDTDSDRTAKVTLNFGSSRKILRIVQVHNNYDSQIILSSLSQTIEPTEGTFPLRYSIKGSGAGDKVDVNVPATASWLEIRSHSLGMIEFHVNANTAGESRTADITLSHAGAQDVHFTLVQAGDSPFFISVADITPSKVTVNFKPKDKTMKYAYSVEQKEVYDRLGAEAYIRAYAESLYKLADENHVSFASLLASGDILNRKVDKLIDGTQYYALAFDINAEGWASGQVTLMPFSTPKAIPSDNRISFEVLSDGTVKVNTTNGDPYIFDVWDIESYSEFPTPMDQAKRFVEYMKGFDGALETYTHRGNYSEDYSKWLIKGKNVAFAFGYNEGITTEVFCYTFEW